MQSGSNPDSQSGLDPDWHGPCERGLRDAVFAKNYRETVLFKIMKELVPLGYDTENAALPNGFV